MIVDSEDEDENVPLFTKQLKVKAVSPTPKIAATPTKENAPAPTDDDDDDVPLCTKKVKVDTAPPTKVVVEVTPKKQTVSKEKAAAPTTIPTAARLPPTPKAPRGIGAAGDGIAKMAMFACRLGDVVVDMPNGRVVAAAKPQQSPEVEVAVAVVDPPRPVHPSTSKGVVKREAEEAVIAPPAETSSAPHPALPPAKKLKQMNMAAFCFKK